MGRFYEKLSYSIGNEDWKTEEKALQITPDNCVFSVTASGDRPLNLLKQTCKQLITVDANPHQTSLLRLKCAALETLNYEEYLQFLGLNEHDNRLGLFERVSKKLHPSEREFWKHHRSALTKGIIYQGALEKLCQFLAKAFQMLRGSKVKELFSFEDLNQQKAFLDKIWETSPWKWSFNFCLHPWLTRIFIGDPGLYLTIGDKITPGKYIYDCMHSFLRRHLAKDSLLLSLVFNGKITPNLYSPYLTQEGGEKIVPHLDKIHSKTANLITFLEGCAENSIDRFSLSDVASYLRRPDYIRMIKAMHRAAKPGARFCIRQFLSSHEIPEELNAYFHREYPLEKELQQEENCFLYRFNVGTIIK